MRKEKIKMSIKGRKKFNQTKTTERKKMWAHPWTSWKRNWTNTEFNKNYSYIFCVFCYVCIVTGPNYQWVSQQLLSMSNNKNKNSKNTHVNRNTDAQQRPSWIYLIQYADSFFFLLHLSADISWQCSSTLNHCVGFLQWWICFVLIVRSKFMIGNA